MLKPSNIAALALLAAISGSAAYAAEKAAEPDNNAVVTVNTKPIPQARIDLRLKAAAQQGQPDSPELRKMVRDELINLEVITQEAVKKGLDKQPEVVQQIELIRQNVLAGAFVQDYVKSHPIAEEKIKQEYENQKAHFGSKEYKVAQIQVASEKEAQNIVAELNKKAKFDKIAKKSSKDSVTKDKGGDMGWVVPTNFPQSFGEAILKLKKGEISAPVQTQFGWHVIKLDDIRDLKAPAYEEVKANLEKHLQQQSIQDAIKALRANADIK